MSISAVVFEGVRRAATYAAMLFTLNAAEPAAAQPPAAQARPAAALAIDGSVAASGLTLAAHHVDARIAGDIASVQVWLLLRNDTAAEVSAQYVLPHPAHIVRGDIRTLSGRAGWPHARTAHRTAPTTNTATRPRHSCMTTSPDTRAGWLIRL